MTGRILYIESACKISLANNHLVVQTDDDKRMIFLNDIGTVVFDSLQTSVTAYLLEELAERGKTVIFCNSKHEPHSGLFPLCGVQNAYSKLSEQLSWQSDMLGEVWSRIVQDKLSSQREVLAINGKRLSFSEQVLPHDSANAEGRFADKYFHALFGRKFVRHLSDNINGALNYGYAIIRAAMSQIVVAHGYIPYIGIHHKSKTNNFNLACDCMEPFRAVVDNVVAKQCDKELDKDYKLLLLACLNRNVVYGGKNYSITDAMEHYLLDIVKSLATNSMCIGELVIL